MERKTLKYLHLIFWLVTAAILLLDALVYSIGSFYLERFAGAFVRIFFNMAAFYFFWFLVSRKTFSKKGMLVLAVAAPLFILAAGYLTAFLSFYPIATHFTKDDPVAYTLEHGLGIRLFELITNVSIFSALGLISKTALIWYENQLAGKDRERQNIRTELAMLKAQVNPHFLFNTLNNIKSLISSSPEKAAHTVRKLKDIMNYMIYDASADTVPLKAEAEHIQNYLELERIRYTDTNFIEFNTEFADTGILVPPLVFMPFIENAFKHGNKLGPSPNVVLNLKADAGGVDFSVRNRKKDSDGARPKNSGFGLAGIRQRLDLIFGKSYELNISDGEKNYEVNLKIKTYES